jgi:mRNA interferase MazF
MQLGDVFWVDLPDRGGREQRGRRPAIIWQDTAAFPPFGVVLAIPLTSRLSALRFPATFRVEPTPQNGLSVSSAALVFQLGVSDVRRISGQVGALSDADLSAIADLARRLQGL